MRATFLLVSASIAGACSYDIGTHRDACDANDDCPVGQSCYRGFCAETPAAADAAAGECDSGAPPESCYDGPAGSEGSGVCRAGKRFCVQGALTQCFDQVTPAPEICNAKDDDCNGEVDDIASQSCAVTSGPVCGIGGVVVCRAGAPSCELSAATTQESCNGVDDDCDGATDEGTAGSCFPDGEAGCSGDPVTGFQCLGLCTPGEIVCSEGVPDCTGAIVPAPEVCSAGNAALDEDCDGVVDETCSCAEGESQPCYSGPPGTLGRGACSAGSQRCSAGVLGQCLEQRLPEPESCTNQGRDDDCNGTLDDVPGLGSACIDDTRQGDCRNGLLQCQPDVAAPLCVGRQPTREMCDPIDQDCDGNPINTFDLNSPASCGSCDVRCPAMQVCCGGRCLAREVIATDPQHCGACNAACGSNQYCCQGKCLNQPGMVTTGPGAEDVSACACENDCGAKACCGTHCVDLIKDGHHCGACGYACGPDQECKGGTCENRR